MKRRKFLQIAGAAAAAPTVACGPAHARRTPPRLAADWSERIAAVPFRRVETDGQRALQTWEGLKAENHGWPVVIGGDEDMYNIASQLTEGQAPDVTAKKADGLMFPRDLHALRLIEEDGALIEADVGDWPRTPPPSLGLSVAYDVLSRRPIERVHLLVLPAADSIEAVSLLRQGGWNACPPPEHHVAAFGAWGERYGAELLGLSGDVINMRVTRRPQTRAEALSLAREQYLYCEDIVLQGMDSLSALAAALMADEWWYFWWD